MEDAMSAAQDAEGSAARENERYVDSLQGRLDKLKTAWQSFSNTFLESDFLKGAVSGLTKFVEILEGLINNLGATGTIGAGLFGFELVKNFKDIKIGDAINSFINNRANGISGVISNVVRSFSDKLPAGISNVVNQVADLIDTASNITDVGSNIRDTVQDVTSGVGDVVGTTTDAANAVQSVTDGVQRTTESIDTVIQTTGDVGQAVDGVVNMGEALEEVGDATDDVSADISWYAEEAANAFTETTGTVQETADAFDNVADATGRANGGLRGFLGTTAGKVAAVAALVVAISALYNAYKNAREEESRLRQETINSSDKFLDASLTFDQAYIKYSGKTSLTAEEEAELAGAIQGTVDALGDKSSALQSIVDGSNNYISSLEQIKRAELEAAEAAATAKKDAAELELKEATIGWESFDGSEVDVALGIGGDKAQDEAIKIANEMGSSFVKNINLRDKDKTEFILSGNADTDEIIAYYETLVDYQERLSDADLIDTNAYKNVTSAIDSMSEAIGIYTDGVYDAAKAQYQLENGIPKTVDEYLAMRKAILNEVGGTLETRKTIAGSLDKDYGQSFDLTSPDVQAKKLVGVLEEYGDKEAVQMEAFLNMRTAVNNNECTVGSYISQFDNINKMTKGWSDQAKEELNTTFGLDVDNIKHQYDEVRDFLSNKDISALDNYEFTPEFRLEKDNIKNQEIESFLDGLSAYELAAVINLKTELDWENDSWDEILKQIEEEAKLVEALSFDINLNIEKEKLTNLSTALSESVSGAGLGEESMLAIKNIYGGLDGYDPSKLFERTANGIRLNTTELKKMNDEYKSTNLEGLENKMSALGDRYNQTREELSNLTYGTDEYNAKARQLSDIEAEISSLEQLTSQIEGLTSAYQEWQMMESAGSQRDMYENVISGLENIDDEISRGWYDDATIEFLELLTGKDLSTAGIEKVKEAYKGLGKTIENTSYSVRDFFTVDDEGNSTNDGVYNFLDAVGQLEEEKFGGKDIVQRDKDKNIIGFDFQLAGGNDVIAEALGVSEELVDIMVRAADDAGFVVSMDGTFQQLDILKEKAQDAANELKNTFKVTDYEFNLNTSKATGEGSLAEQYEEASKIWEKYKKYKEGSKEEFTVDMSAEGAEEAFTLISTLQSMIDKLSEPVYMDINATQVEKDLQVPLGKLQEYETLTQAEHQLKLKGTDTSEIEASKNEILDYLEELQNSNPEIAAKLGIEGLSREEIESKLEKGEIEIPATVDIQMDMSDDIKDMKLLMMNQLGILSDEEVKLKVGYEIDDSIVDNLDDKEQKVVLKYIEENKDTWDKLSEDKKEVIIDLVAKGEDIESLLEDEEKEVVVDFVVENKEEFDKLSDEEKEVVVDLVTDDSALEALENHQVEIEAFARIFGVEKVDDLKKKLEGLTDEQILVFANVLGQINVEKLKSTVAGLDDKTIQAIAKALGEGDVNGLKTTINGLDDKTVQAIAEALGYSDVNELNSAIDNLDPKTVQAVAEALGITDVDSLKAAIDRLSSKDVDAVANVKGKDDVTGLKSAINSLKGKTITVWAQIKKKASDLWSKLTGGGTVDGTAHINGTAFADGTVQKSGRAFKQGNWGTKSSGVALGAEIGPELLVRNGRWHLIGEDGAQFFGYKRGDIIFNADQTREIFEKGKITHGNGRGKALASGTAFSNGSTGYGGAGRAGGSSSSSSSSSSKSSSKSKSSDTSKAKEEAEEFEETLDWIEKKIDRIERAIDQLDTKASSVYRSWSERNSSLLSEISKVGEEIALQEKAYKRYIEEANSVGLDESYAEKVRNGKIDIETITDEDLADKIGQYQDWYEKALDCKDAILELQEAEADLYKQRFDNVITRFDGILSVVEHEKNILEEYINQSEAQAWLVSSKYYDALAKNERENIALLKSEKRDLLDQLQAGMTADGEPIKKGSEAWYEMIASVDEVTLAIKEGETALLEYQQTIQQLSWEQFDLLQEKISAVTEEADFLIELLSSDKLYDDRGQLTNEGMSTMGLHGVNYNVYMRMADDTAKEAERIKKELEKDPFDLDLEARYREMIALQQEHILAAEDEKNAIRDMVEEGIELELDALQELIDKKNEQLDSEKDLYEYQKKVKEQVEEIAALEKQLSAFSGDDSEEARQKIQQIKVDLEDAREELEETEYDKYIEDTKKLLDELYLEYETILNARLDNLDALVMDMIVEINANAATISDTLYETAADVGYKLSDSMQTIWDANNTSANSINGVITYYGDKFATAQTSTNAALNAISLNLSNMISQLNKKAETNVKAANTSSAAFDNKAQPSTQPKKEPTKTETPKETKPAITDDTLKSIAAAIWVYGKAAGWENDPSRKNKLQEKLGADNAKKVQSYINKDGANGNLYRYWFNNNKKLNDYKYSAFKTGKKNIDVSQLAWTQEDGQEFIIRPSDGAILTPVAKGDSVLNTQASNNIWDMANNPVDFIKDNLNLGTVNAPNNSSSQNSYVQNLDKVVFHLPNVKNYDQLLSEMQKDKSFEKLILAMTIDRIAGGSSLAKGKAIR